MVATDVDEVPARQVLGAVLDEVDAEAQRRTWRKDVGAPRYVLFENVVLRGPADLLRLQSLLLGYGCVHRERDGCRPIHGQRRARFLERQSTENRLHVFERIDRYADDPDFAPGARVIRVEPKLRRQVERDEQPALALTQQVAEPFMGLGSRTEARVLAHRPQAAVIHRRVDAARVGIFTGKPYIAQIIPAVVVERRVDRCRACDGRFAACLARGTRAAFERGFQTLLFPRLLRFVQRACCFERVRRSRHIEISRWRP